MANLKIKDENGNWIGIASIQGEPGPQGEPGTNGTNGKDGANGKDGTSCTHSWNGTVLTITSASGTSSADLKGPQGEPGPQGDTGEQGPQGPIGPQGPQGEPGAGSSVPIELTVGYSSSKPIILEDLEPGIYVVNKSLANYYIRATADNTGSTAFYPADYTLRVLKKPSQSTGAQDVLAFFISSSLVFTSVLKSDTSSGLITQTTANTNIYQYALTNTMETITSKWTYNVLPETSQTPTKAAQFTNKQYVDNSITGKQNKVLSGTTAPTSDLGVDGDVYLLEIDEAAYNNFDYGEVVVGTYRGKPLYRNIFNVGALPNSSTRIVAHGIANIDYIYDYTGMATNSAGAGLKLPRVHTSSSLCIVYEIDKTNVTMSTSYDFSGFNVEVTMYYTKTTD